MRGGNPRPPRDPLDDYGGRLRILIRLAVITATVVVPFFLVFLGRESLIVPRVALAFGAARTRKANDIVPSASSWPLTVSRYFVGITGPRLTATRYYRFNCRPPLPIIRPSPCVIGFSRDSRLCIEATSRLHRATPHLCPFPIRFQIYTSHILLPMSLANPRLLLPAQGRRL
jgi:hypothetical protein